MERYFRWATGRKVGLGLIGFLAGIPMAVILEAGFGAWAGFTMGVLFGTQVSVAGEDIGRARAEVRGE